MGKTYSKLWVHCVWSTKNRKRFIKPKFEQELFDFINAELKKMGCGVLNINGMEDHIHCLFLLNPQKSLTDVIKQIKGSSSYFINSKNLLPEKFIWQRGFGAFTVSESQKQQVYEYIRDQKNHHAKKGFETEYIQFLKLHEFEDIELD
jgi:putative transposase